MRNAKYVLGMLFILSWCHHYARATFQLRVMKVKMSNDTHSGMDGGMFGKRWFGYGGDFEMTICSNSVADEHKNCCKTGELNTADNNWEKGETNYFIGHQLNGCQDFKISSSSMTTLKVQHYGSDGGKIKQVEIRGSLRHKNELLCIIDRKLDNSESVTVNCAPKEENKELVAIEHDENVCMGKKEFCNVKINHFSFAGSHNSGTGMSGSIKPVECLFKNHDLTIQEQLDFGIRFFDTDVAYSYSLPGCNGLEAVHGKSGIYYCFGAVKHMFQQVIDWANANPEEVILIHFGSLYKGRTTLNPLLREIKDSFLNTYTTNTSVRLNKVFQETGKWPTLGEAIATNERVFIFIVEKSDEKATLLDSNEEATTDYIKVFKVDDYDAGKPLPVLKKGWASFASTYGSGKIGSNCENVVENVGNLCKQLSADFVKVATYGTPWKSMNLVFRKSNICIDTYAKMCNVRMQDIIDECNKHKNILNVILSDFPNYPSSSKRMLPEIVDELNSFRAT